ncbi:MAG: CapA family protein [Rhodospirillales bacterium]|nr:CapA family protein [Rhodospirillales bacterium]
MCSEFNLALTGDAILQRRLLSATDPVLVPLFDRIRAADLAFTNLEVLANDYRGEPALESGGSHFGAPAWVLDDLRTAGFELFAAATNHALDYGTTGLLLTIEALEARGIAFAGIGRNLEDARRPAYVTHPKATVALIACAATFARGQEASEQRPDMPGRPGLAPLRHETVYDVSAEQMAQLRAIADATGLEARRQQMLAMGFQKPPRDPAILPFGSMNFRAAAVPAIRTTARAADVEGLARWVREAAALADIVVVSLHAHEQGETKEEPAEFIPPFARRMIDEGASLVVGHGPHLLRGMELYRGRPIFYSLGNFIGQNELVPRLPSDSYERFAAEPTMTPGQVYRLRTDDDRRGFPADRRYWETLVPVLAWREGVVSGIELIPVGLGLGERAHRRGRPRLATGEEAAGILDRFAKLSAPFGTAIERHGDTARVRLG